MKQILTLEGTLAIVFLVGAILLLPDEQLWRLIKRAPALGLRLLLRRLKLPKLFGV